MAREISLNICAIQVHTPFFFAHASALSEHEWYFVPSSYTLAWGPERPLSKNCHVLTWKEAKERLSDFDVYIISTEEQLSYNREELPTIYLEHNFSPVQNLLHHMEDPSVPVMWKKKAEETFKKRPNVKYFVFPTYASFDALPWKGESKTVLTCLKGMSMRPLASGYPLWERVTKGLPRILAGRYNDDIRESIGYQDYEMIRRLYASSRVYFSASPFWYMTATQEALFTGMPVVTIDLEAPFQNEEEMIISQDPAYLRRRIEELLESPEECARIGKRGREKYLSLLSPEEVRRAWKKAIETSVTLYQDRKRVLDRYVPLKESLESLKRSFDREKREDIVYLGEDGDPVTSSKEQT